MSGGGVASIPTWVYSHGLNSVNHIGIFQDHRGAIRQQITNRPSRVGDIIVPADRNPRRNGFALVGWGQGAHDSNPPLELRLYWINTSGQIFERCFSTSGGAGAEWYDGSLTGQFKAAPYSSIAANASQANVSSTYPNIFRVYFQEEGTNRIRELLKEDSDTFAPFKLVEPVNTRRPPGLQGTEIATDTSFPGAAEIYYQIEGQKWYIDGAGAQEGFRPHDEFPYTAGASICVAGSIAQGNATVVTVNENQRIVVTTYKKDTGWSPSSELIKVRTQQRIWISKHPQPAYTTNLHTHSTTIAASQSYNPRILTLVGFTNTSAQGWDVLPCNNEH